MTDRQFRRYSGEDQVQQADLSDFLEWEEAEFGARAYNGEATDSSATVRDETARFGNQDNLPASAGTPISLASRNVARYIHGSNILWQGRIIRKDYHRDEGKTDRQRKVGLSFEDVNTDLRGVVVNNLDVAAGTDVSQIQSILAHYLSGSPSPTRNLNGSNYVSSSNTVTMPARTYQRTTVLDVLSEIAATANKNFWVWSPRTTAEATSITGYFVYDGHDAVVEQCPYRVTDREDEVRANPRYWFPPIWNVGPAETENGQEMLSGVYYYFTNEDGDNDHVHVTNDVVAAIYSHYEIAYTDDSVTTTAQATQKAEALLSYRALEERTNNITIGPMDDTQIGSIRVGQTISVKFRASPSADDGYKARRITQLKFTSPVPGTYFVHLQLDRPVRFRAYGFGNPGPVPPRPEPVDACTRLYFSTDAGGIDPSTTSVWENDSAGPAYDGKTAKATADSTYGGTGTGSTASSGGSGNDIKLGQHAYLLGSATAAILAAGGGHFRMQARTRSRYGLGISEAAQDNISQITLRVYDSGGSPRGYAYAGHSLSSSAGSVKWVAQSVHRNSTFPPAAADNTLSAVSGCVAGDYLVVESGYRSFTVGTTGAAMLYTSDSGFDLPEDDNSTSVYNAWLDICGSGAASGSTTQPNVNPGEESPGTSNVYAPIDHTHAHGILDPDDIHMHAEYQVHQMVTNDTGDPSVTDDADSGYSRGWHWNNTTSGDVFFLRDSTAGAADWLLLAPESGGLTDHDHTGGGDGGDLDAPVIDGYAVFNEESAPSTPSSGQAVIYVKSDGRFYSKGDDGVERGPFDAAGAGGGSTGVVVGAPSGFPYIAATATTELTVNQTSHTINLPSVVAGDLMLMFVLVDGGTTITATGFTSVTTGTSGTDVSLEVLYKFASGSEGATMSITSSASEKVSCLVARIADHHASTPPEGAGTGSGSASVNSNPPSLTPSWGADDDLWIAMGVHDSSNPGAGFVHVGTPLPYLYLWHHAAAATDDGTVTLGYLYLNATSENPLSFVAPSGEQWAAATVAVRPV